MPQSPFETMTKLQRLLQLGLGPFVRTAMSAAYGERWTETEYVVFRDGVPDMDVAKILAIMGKRWPEVFRQRLGEQHRHLVKNLRRARKPIVPLAPFACNQRRNLSSRRPRGCYPWPVRSYTLHCGTQGSFSDPQIAEIDGRGLVWNGESEKSAPPEPAAPPSQPPSTYTPPPRRAYPR